MRTLTIAVEEEEQGRRSRNEKKFPAPPFLSMDPRTAGEGFLQIFLELYRSLDQASPPVPTSPDSSAVAAPTKPPPVKGEYDGPRRKPGWKKQLALGES